jgi:S1-C subfamily serine protease
VSAPSDPNVGWFLKAVGHQGAAARVPLGAAGVSLGRAPTNQVALSEQDHPQVSAHHARIAFDDAGNPTIDDLGSRNGTFVNDHQVQHAHLHDGDVLRLGPGGPQFVVEQVGRGGVTQFFPGGSPAKPEAKKDEMGQSTVFRVKRALGVPEDADIGQLVRTSEQRSRRWMVVALGAALALVAATFLVTRSIERRELAAIAAANAELRERLGSATNAFERQRVAWEAQREALQHERAALQQRIQEVAANEQASSAELRDLRSVLDATDRKLQRYDPVNLEKARLSDVGRVQQAVVFIETSVRFRSTKSNRLMRIRAGDADGEPEMTWDEADALFERESSGSGFCIRADGAIVTNAHVVRPPGSERPVELGDVDTLQPELAHTVVFSGSERRHPATLLKVLYEGDDDLALLKIEPFPEMPHLPAFATDVPPPAPLTEVYLHGFPLGKRALQDGERVIASSFRGILSRTVSNWLQVDAAVHPGNSGGPLTDAAGRVIGVVCRVQRIDGETFAPDMGYAIPVQSVARLLADGDGK